MPWRFLWTPLDNIQPVKYDDAHLHNYRIKCPGDKPRLLAHKLPINNNLPEFEINLYEDLTISSLNNCLAPINAIIDPTFPNSIISDDIIKNWTNPLNIRGSKIISDVFSHPVYIQGTISAYFLFNGDIPDSFYYSPRISDDIKKIEWGVISNKDAPRKNFILIGGDILSKIVTIFSNGWMMLGADEEKDIEHSYGESGNLHSMPL